MGKKSKFPRSIGTVPEIKSIEVLMQQATAHTHFDIFVIDNQFGRILRKFLEIFSGSDFFKAILFTA